MLLYILLLFTLLILNKNINLQSNIDNLYYNIQIRSKYLISLYYLSKLNNFIKYLIKNLDTNNNIYKKYSNNIKFLENKINSKVILSESSKIFNKTRTENKDHIHLCMYYNKKLYDINHLKYVVIHEISHMICNEIGHTESFYEINKFY